MTNASEITRVYFSHDQDARGDDKITEMMFAFRKLAKNLERSELESLIPLASYGIYWAIIEYMHRNSFQDKDVELLADTLRIDTKFLMSILEDFRLFGHLDGEYVSNRVLKNLEKQKEKSAKAKKSAEVRWLLQLYERTYKDIFGIKPILGEDEKSKLINYSNAIENFKDILPDILYTLKDIKFDGNVKYNPRSNWLLSENNLTKVLHGEFGKLKHKKTKEEIKAEEEAKKAEAESKSKPSAIDIEMNPIINKVDAIEFIAKRNYQHPQFINPSHKDLMKRFDITTAEITTRMKEFEDG